MSILADYPLSINRFFSQKSDRQLLEWFVSVAVGDDPAGVRLAFSDWVEETGPAARPDRVQSTLPADFTTRYFRALGRSRLSHPRGVLDGWAAYAGTDTNTKRLMGYAAIRIAPTLSMGEVVTWQWPGRPGGPELWAVVLPDVIRFTGFRMDELWLLGECFGSALELPWLVAPVSLDPDRRHAGPTLVLLGDGWEQLAPREGGRDV